MTDINVSEGELVWYNERKGYGFVRIGDTEVFLHRSTLDQFGLVRLLTGDKVTVSLTVNEHGEVRAVVKFFNDIRGYGFVTAEDIAEDVFVHSRVLNDCGVHSLMQGQKLLIKVDDAGKGPQVQAVRLLNE